ncbi:MAG: ribbon-helix-helix protein, CopG family [Sphingomonadales bacterium]
MRTIIDLPERNLAALEKICAKEGISRAEAIRRAVDAYLANSRISDEDDIFGMWSGQDIDGLEYQRNIRAEWPE